MLLCQICHRFVSIHCCTDQEDHRRKEINQLQQYRRANFIPMQTIAQSQPFEFKPSKNKKYSQQSEKYYRKIALWKIKDKKRLRRIVRLRRIHLERYISVKYKGGKWWDKMMKIYFGQVTSEEIMSCKENSTSEVMLKILESSGKAKSYCQLCIFQDYPQLFQDNILKFLFHGVTDQGENEGQDFYQLIVYGYKSYPSAEDQDQCYISDPNAALLPHPQKLSTIKVQDIQREHDIRAEYRANASLYYVTTIRDTTVLYNCFNYQQAFKKKNYSHIECELTLIPQKIAEIHQENQCLWDKIHENFEQQQTRLLNLQKWESEVEGLQTKIACRDRMFFFKKGFSNKTEDELEQALQELQLEEKRLIYSRRTKKSNKLASYNDCKICFYPEVKQNNYIIFCSVCRVSYHLYCYGLKTVQNAQEYICDSCLYMQVKDYEYEEVEFRPQCGICFSKQQFPLKQVQKQFYHVSCLFFFNYAVTTNFQIGIKPFSAEQIRKKVRENVKPRCLYCLPESQQNGLTLKCSQQQCQSHFHPICGYLKGCQFQIVRKQQLQISAKCHLHTFLSQHDEQIRQVYLRRFFCNYKNIQKLNQQEFKPLYRDQVDEIKLQLRKLEGDGIKWEEYDTLSKRERRTKAVQKENQMQKYRDMSIEELLEISAVTQKEVEQYNQQQIYQEQEEAQFMQHQIIQID